MGSLFLNNGHAERLLTSAVNRRVLRCSGWLVWGDNNSENVAMFSLATISTQGCYCHEIMEVQHVHVGFLPLRDSPSPNHKAGAHSCRPSAATQSKGQFYH